MDVKTAGMIRWICQMYDRRGMGLTGAQWDKFAGFCDRNGIRELNKTNMDTKTAGMVCWICRIYDRGAVGIADDQWTEFARFCERNGLIDCPPPGVRRDGKLPWDAFEERLWAEDYPVK